MKSLIGIYFKTKPLAIKKAQEKNRAWKENRYEVLEYNNGFMVVSGRQINEGNLKENSPKKRNEKTQQGINF